MEKDILVEEYSSDAQEIDEEMQANGGLLVDAGVAYCRFVSIFQKDSLMLSGSLIDIGNYPDYPPSVGAHAIPVRFLLACCVVDSLLR